MAVFVPGHPVVDRRPAKDEIPKGNASVHVVSAHHMDRPRYAGEVAVASFSPQEPPKNEPGKVLRQLPHLQEDGGQEGQGTPHITRTR